MIWSGWHGLRADPPESDKDQLLLWRRKMERDLGDLSREVSYFRRDLLESRESRDKIIIKAFWWIWVGVIVATVVWRFACP